MPLQGGTIWKELLTSRTEQPLGFDLVRVSAVCVFDYVPGGGARHVAELTKHSRQNAFLRLLLPVAPHQVHSHGSHVRETDITL